MLRAVRAGALVSSAQTAASNHCWLTYTVRYGSDVEFVCIDTSKESVFRGHRLFEFPKHWAFIEASFPASPGPPTWRIPFAHHPPFNAGPQHHNTRDMARLFPLFQRAGVRVMFSGHEHNFQHARADDVDYFVTGAAGKFRGGTPGRLADYAGAYCAGWSPFLSRSRAFSTSRWNTKR